MYQNSCCEGKGSHTPPFSRPSVSPHVREIVLREYFPAMLHPPSEMTSFCQKEFILDDFKNRDHVRELQNPGNWEKTVQ